MANHDSAVRATTRPDELHENIMKWQSGLIFIIGAASLLLAIHLTLGLFKSTPATFPWGEVARLQAKQKQLQADIHKDIRSLVNPGPEPWLWLHPVEHYFWQQQADAFNEIQARIDRRQKDLKLINQAQADALLSFWPKVVKSSAVFLQWIWQAIIKKILHGLLIIALISLSARVFIRWLLLENKFGSTRV